MTQARNLEEYERLSLQRSKIHGSGLSTGMTLPCPFCAAEDFVTYTIAGMEEVMGRPNTCRECGRSMKCVYRRRAGAVDMEFVQTGGDDPPEWVPKMRRET